MQVDEATEGIVLRKRKEKIPKHLKREANEKEMDGFTKRVLRIPVEKHFDEFYYIHRLWMFFRETKETEEDIRRMFHYIRERMKLRITMKKKSDHGKFTIPCMVKGIEFPHALCDTGASVSILPKVMADQSGLEIEPSSESFTFVDLSERSSGGIIRDLEVNVVELGNDLGYIAACHCGAEYETEYSESIDTHTVTSIDSNESSTTDERYPTSLNGKQPVNHSTLPDQYYPDFAFQQPNNRGRDDYSIGSWADSGFHESFAVETVIISSNEDPTEEYDEDYWKERATEIAMQDERYSTNSFNNTPPPTIDSIYSASVDTHPHPAKRSSASIDTTLGTSIDINAAALEKEKGNIPIPSRFTNTYIRSFAPQITSHETEAEKMNAPTNQSEGTSRKSIRSKNPNSADKRLPSIDTPVSTSFDSHSKPKLSLSTKKNMSIDYDFLLPGEFGIFRDQDGLARAMDGTILQVSREDIADILQLANGGDNLFMQQHNIPDNNLAVPDKYPRATTTGIGSHQSCTPVGQASIDKVASTSYGAKKFRWEQKDEYGVYKDESGYARSLAGEMIPFTKDNIRKILERSSLFEESHIFLPEHATSFTPTKGAAEIYTKDEINEMVTGLCGAHEKLGDELKTLVDDTYQPLDRSYNELFRSMAEMRTEIESMQHNLEKEATTLPSIDANKATSIDVKPQTSQISAEPRSLAEKKDEWEIAYINTRINDVYKPLNNNADWLSTRIDLLQQELDTIRMNDPQPHRSISATLHRSTQGSQPWRIG
ncbi:hypothetical protein F2Q69_00047308 [Brassica cretica]|uniref:Uncharacterized protein n=1 Tax=Brassica cretica TaxID=69181 RepID=A0A8S9Q6Z2_BRACR|nr:hypothetical protein F2Q69_00047308 [Brassica cretica]